MSSWVRYSIAVYVGLLLAGSLAIPGPESTATAARPMRTEPMPIVVLPPAPEAVVTDADPDE